MNNDFHCRLALSLKEKKTLRSKGIKLRDLGKCTVEEIQAVLQAPLIRAMEIKALAEFQLVPSVGIKFAHDLISLGYYSLDELKTKDPVQLYQALEKHIDAWADPCLEDQFRLVVHYANDRSGKKNWWDFTGQRKAYRQMNGYPPDRPKRPWYELPQYKAANKVHAKAEGTKKDVSERIKKSLSYMKKNYTEKITLSQLSRIAFLSPFHFQRSFKSIYEVTPLEYLTHLRLKRASQLLKKTKKPVQEIVLQSGFENSSSFVRLFRQHFKQTPLSYRSDYLNKILAEK